MSNSVFQIEDNLCMNQKFACFTKVKIPTVKDSLETLVSKMLDIYCLKMLYAVKN